MVAGFCPPGYTPLFPDSFSKASDMMLTGRNRIIGSLPTQLQPAGDVNFRPGLGGRSRDGSALDGLTVGKKRCAKENWEWSHRKQREGGGVGVG